MRSNLPKVTRNLDNEHQEMRFSRIVDLASLFRYPERYEHGLVLDKQRKINFIYASKIISYFFPFSRISFNFRMENILYTYPNGSSKTVKYIKDYFINIQTDSEQDISIRMHYKLISVAFFKIGPKSVLTHSLDNNFNARVSQIKLDESFYSNIEIIRSINRIVRAQYGVLKGLKQYSPKFQNIKKYEFDDEIKRTKNYYTSKSVGRPRFHSYNDYNLVIRHEYKRNLDHATFQQSSIDYTKKPKLKNEDYVLRLICLKAAI